MKKKKKKGNSALQEKNMRIEEFIEQLKDKHQDRIQLDCGQKCLMLEHTSPLMTLLVRQCLQELSKESQQKKYTLTCIY